MKAPNLPRLAAALSLALFGCQLDANTSGARQDPGAACPSAAAVDLAALGLSGEVRFLAASGCASPDGDGSAARPFSRVEELQGLAAGTTLIALPGRHLGRIALPAGVDLVGAVAKAPAAGAAAQSGDVVLGGVDVAGAGASTLRNVRVDGAVGVGVSARGAALTLDGVVVYGATAAGAAGAGHGVFVSEGASAALRASAIVGCEGVGLLAKGAGAISIVEPIFSKPPRSDAVGAVGIVEPIFQPAAQLAANQGGGVAIVEPIFAPKGDAASAPALLLRGVDVRANLGFGVALFGADARIEASALRDTKAGPSGAWADGLLVLPGAASARPKVVVDGDSVVLGNARSGVVLLAAGEVEVAADVSDNGYAGAWVAAADGVLRVQAEATLWRNALCGVGAAAGADLQVQGAQIAETRGYDVGAAGEDRLIGDGVGVFDGARATIRDAELVQNARAAVLIHAAATKADGTPDVEVAGVKVVGGKYAVVVNGAPAPDFAAANRYEQAEPRSGGVGADAPADRDNADVPAQTSFCVAGDAECLPAF